jgi:hypothetical protein
MIIAGVIGTQELSIVLIGVLFFGLLPLFALIDILRSNFEGNNKLIWILVVLFANVIGSILYFIIGRNQKIG